MPRVGKKLNLNRLAGSCLGSISLPWGNQKGEFVGRMKKKKSGRQIPRRGILKIGTDDIYVPNLLLPFFSAFFKQAVILGQLHYNENRGRAWILMAVSYCALTPLPEHSFNSAEAYETALLLLCE